MSEPTVLYANNSESIRQQQQQHHQQATTSADFSEEAPSAEVDIDVQVRNVVCNYSLPLHIDLRRIALNTGNVTLDKSKGVLLKQKRHPSCYVKIHSSGKIYIVGCRSETDCRIAARSVARMVQRGMGKMAESVKIRNYRVCNVLATCKMPFGIRIEELAQKYPHEAQYEPELSVGLVWRSVDPKGTMRIHTTGSITLTGATSEENVIRAFSMIYPIVQEFQCPLRLRETSLTGGGARKRKLKRENIAVSSGTLRKRGRTHDDDDDDVPTSISGAAVYFSDEDLMGDDDDDDM